MKKDRKVVRREGGVAVGSETHKNSEIESCQRLLEIGAIGARTFDGPHVVGDSFTRQDKLLDEIKWMAVDVFEQRKAAVGCCAFISEMVRKYWMEKSRGKLEEAASMIQAYWFSVAREIRVPLADDSRDVAIFKLNTLQSIRPSGSPRQSISGPSSLLPTPTAGGVTPNGLATPSPEESHFVEPDKKSIAHGLVHNWLTDRTEENPPSAEGTTGLADFSVQIVKHHLREEHTHLPHPTQSSGSDGLEQTDGSPKAGFDFLIPIDTFVRNDETLSSRETYKRAITAAVESAVQMNLAKRGIDGVRCVEQQGESQSHVLVSQMSLETQRTIFQEIAATNIMSKAPQLFGLCSSAGQSESRRAQTVDKRAKEPEVGNNNNSSAQPKHYFVSLIASSFTPSEWSSAEDYLLRDAVREHESDGKCNWDLVSSSFNWRMKIWLKRESFRSATECCARFNALPPADAVPVDASRRKKFATAGGQNGAFTESPLNGRGQRTRRSWNVTSKDNVEFTEIEQIEVDNPYFVCRTVGGPCPTPSANSFERRGIFALLKPPTNYFAKAFFHFPSSAKELVFARGASASERENLSYAYEVSASTTFIAHAPVVISPDASHVSTIIQSAQSEALEAARESIDQLMYSRSTADPPKKAFGVEDLVKKNPAAVQGDIPLYISGQMICPLHPSFSNMTRIAEMTLTRLISSVSDSSQQTPAGPPQVPVPIGSLFQYCALFRKKYPAVFTSQHKINKPSIPPPRSQSAAHAVNRNPVRPLPQPQHQPAPIKAPAPLPIQTQVAPSSAPSVPASLPLTPSEPVSASGSISAGGSSAWLRTSQRKRGSNAGGVKTPPSPTGGTPKTPTQQPAESSFMVAGGPSLYGQFNHQRGRQNR
jgi:hypothetical protein